jgi:hypothetical protein
MFSRQDFYSQRDKRSTEYGIADDLFERPVGIYVGRQAAASVAGQVAVLALVNMVARIHRSVILEIPSVRLHRPAIVPAQQLDEAAFTLARSINPFIEINCGRTAEVAIGVGADAPARLNWYMGAIGQVALLRQEPVPLCGGSSASLGGCLASCLAAAALVKLLVGYRVDAAQLSAWNVADGPDAQPGPPELGNLHVGDVLQIGAGGVGSCLDYWLHEFGVLGHWVVLDGDSAELHNTNRSLGMFPSDAGWLTGRARSKAVVGASLIGGVPLENWYDELGEEIGRFELVLPLANERAVREAVASRGESIILHATTSSTWEAQLHRHLPDKDDCIVCRMPQREASKRFACSSGELRASSGISTDAALPFLSATAALLLLSGLYRLQNEGAVGGHENFWAVQFKGVRGYSRQGIFGCHEGCRRTLPPQVRARINCGQRWFPVDAAAN